MGRPSIPVAPLQIRSEGQRLLLHIPGTLAVLAKRVGTTSQSVKEWRTGLAKPTRRMRAKVYSALGIPVGTWDERPTVAATEPTVPGAAGVELPLPPPSTPISIEDTGTTMDGCLRLLATVRADMAAPTTLPSERVKLMAAEARILKFRAELESRVELSEDRYVNEHPAWVRVRNEIARVLAAYPEAARAVAEALERIGA